MKLSEKSNKVLSFSLKFEVMIFIFLFYLIHIRDLYVVISISNLTKIRNDLFLAYELYTNPPSEIDVKN